MSIVIHTVSSGLSLSMVNQDKENGLFRVILVKPDKFLHIPLAPFTEEDGVTGIAKDGFSPRDACT